MRKFKTQLRNLGRHIREGTRDSLAGLRAAPADTMEMLSVTSQDVPANDRALFGALSVGVYVLGAVVIGTFAFLLGAFIGTTLL